MKTIFFENIFTRYPVKTRRALEILPGFVSWGLILFPIWGSLLIPSVVAIFILFFDVYWFYKSINLTITAYIASLKIKNSQAQDWFAKARKLKHFEDTAHIVIIPTYRESVTKLHDTIQSLAQQTFPKNRLYVILAMEERETDAPQKAAALIKEFSNVFGELFATFHPDVPGEVKGKSSNESFAGKIAYNKLIKSGILDINSATVSSVDADTIFDKQYFSYLTYVFLKDDRRYQKFWQSANVHYNNFWKVPAPTRVISFFGNLWRISLLVQRERLIANSTYSLSFLLLHKIGYWDTDVIPEDYRIFFKAFYKERGNVWVDPIFLKTSMDAAQSTNFIKSIINKYHQERRWSWGVSDDPLFIKWWLTVPNVPFMRKTMMLYNVLLDHFLWPVNWFIITVAANIMPLINPVFSRTALGYNLPRMAGFILTLCILTTLIMVVIDYHNRPAQKSPSLIRYMIFPLEFILLPIVGFFLATLPALISHTQLMIGKRLEYKVTEKI